MHDSELQERLARVRLFALDVDGVLTDGGVVYIGDQELQRFDVKDGAGLVWVRKAGVTLAFVTGRGCESTERRAAELGVAHLSMREGPKHRTLARIQADCGIPPEATLAMGDDLADLGLRKRAGLFAAPADAVPEVRAAADLVTTAPGGRGAVREVAERLLRAKGAWDALTEAGTA